MENTKELKAVIFDIQSFSTHDGPGIRTNIFFKGCPLRCLWCANPEGQKFMPELFYSKTNCVGCMRCAAKCPHNAVTRYADPADIEKYGFVRHDRRKCNMCSTHDCVKACMQTCLSVTGEEMTVDDVMQKVHRDASVYGMKGGVTLSGGDPLCHPEFAAELLKRCKSEGINTALESELCVPIENLKTVMPYIDLYLTDLKIVNEEDHIKATGASNKQILDNLRLIAKTCPEKICLRIPIIPGYTDGGDNIDAIGAFCAENGIRRVNILSYHKLGATKHERLGGFYPLPNMDPPSRERMELFAELFACHGVECRID